MFGWFKKDKPVREAASRWHSAIMEKARDTMPFQQGLVEDTLEGRFHMVTLVSTLVMRRLRDFDNDGRALADGVYKNVFSSFDHALREEGVGDSSIARKIRKMGEEFFGLARAIDGAFDEDDATNALTRTLVKNVNRDDVKARALADWVQAAERALSVMTEADALAGIAPWSDA
jgi:cytochrome b pre-mRNA-processing protein 3